MAGSLGLRAAGAEQLIRQIERGLSYRALESLHASSGLSISAIAHYLGIPERTLARRKVSGRLSPAESDRLVRMTNLFDHAVELLEGDAAAAVAWLIKPAGVLGNRAPLDYARTEVGAREVEDLIGRLEHGVFS